MLDNNLNFFSAQKQNNKNIELFPFFANNNDDDDDKVQRLMDYYYDCTDYVFLYIHHMQIEQ